MKAAIIFKVIGMVFLLLAWLSYCSIISTIIPSILWGLMLLLWGIGALRTCCQLRHCKETIGERVVIFLRHNVDGLAVIACGLLMTCTLNGAGDTEIAMLLGSFVLVGFVCE